MQGSTAIRSKIEQWVSWYRGKVDNFHTYEQYNGVKMVKRDRLSLSLPKKICEDKADLLLNEKVEINIGDKNAQAYVDEVLHSVNFWVEGNQLVELSNALGTGAFVVFVKNNKVALDTIEATNIYPLAYESGLIVDCAFASKVESKGEALTFLNIHEKIGDEYIIRNIFLDESGDETAFPPWFTLAPEIHTGSHLPMFQIIKPNIVNSFDWNTPMGISVFANAIDVLKGIDIIYDSYINEFTLGKKRVFLDPSVMQVHLNGEGAGLTPTFDTNDVAFYGLSGLNESSDPIKEINMELRIDEHIQAINNNLNLLSSKCGFGQDYYAFEGGGLKTATEVVSENSDLFRRIKKDEIIINKALVGMVRAIIYLANNMLGAGLNESADITINFDDSIIEDKAEERKQALIERNAGLIDDVQYFTETREMTQEQALEFVAEMKARMPDEPPPEGEYHRG